MMRYLFPIVKDRVWILVIALAWFAIAIFTTTGDDGPSSLRNPIWSVGATVIGVFTLYFFFVERASPNIIRLVTFMVTVYSIARGLTLIQNDFLANSLVWFMYTSLTLHAYRLGKLLGEVGNHQVKL